MDTNYGISMNSILRMDILHDARLLAGASGTDDRYLGQRHGRSQHRQCCDRR